MKYEKETEKVDNEEGLLQEAREIFDICVDVESDNRDRARDDINFARMSEQWDEQDVRNRTQEGRPFLTMNRLPTFLRQVVNDARQNKPQIKVTPVDDSADPDTAEIYNGLIRNIEYCSDSGSAYDTAIEQSVSGGFGYFRIDLEYPFDDAFELDIRINRIPNQFSVYGDPYSEAVDSSDWNQCFILNYIPCKQFERQYPNAEKTDWDHDFRDVKEEWYTGDNVTVAEYWKRVEVPRTVCLMSDGSIYEKEWLYAADHTTGITNELLLMVSEGVQKVEERETKTMKVTQYVMTAAEVLEEHEWPGRFIPIVPVYGDEINVEGKRHFKSLIHDAKDAQTMFNYWRTTTTEMVADAPRTPWIGPKGAFDEDNGWDTANSERHPYLEYNGNIPPQRQPFAGIPAGALNEALTCSDDMKSIMGLHDAALGARSNETSGRAILARQREGDVSTFHFIDNLSRAIRHAGKILIDLIPKIYNKPRIVRVLGQDETPQNVQINQKFYDDKGMLKVYDLAAGKYDLAVKAGPAFTTRREEAANQMLELARVFPQAAPILGDIMAKYQDWPGADEIQERLKTLLPPQIQGGAMVVAQQQVQAAQQEIAQLKAQLQDKMMEQSIDQQEAQTKRMEVQIRQYEAQTKRIESDIEAYKAQAEVNLRYQEAGRPVAPPPDLTPIMQHLEVLRGDIAAQHEQLAMQHITQPQTAPVRTSTIKEMKAIKQPDGSYYCVSEVETPEGLLVKRAHAIKDEEGNMIMRTVEEVA